MKKTILTFTIIFTQCIAAQSNDTFSCSELKNGVSDKTIFDTLPNGKLVARFDYVEKKLYVVTVDNKILYYISKKMLKKVKNSIKKNDCKNVTIFKVESANSKKIIDWYNN